VSDPSLPGDPFSALAESLDDLVFVWREEDGAMLWTNRAFVRETGFTAEDFRFKNQDNPFIHPSDLEHVLEALAAFTASDAKQSLPIQNRFIDAWGRVHSLVSVVHKVTFRGAPALLFISRHDASVEQAVDREASYRHLVENADDGILKLSREGRVVYSNRRFQQMVKLRPVEIAKLDLTALLAPEDRPVALEVLARLRAGSARESFEARLATIEGQEPIWVAVNASSLESADPEAPFSFMAIARDITPARRLERQMRQAQRLEGLGTLAGGIAHDFNNIVTGVLANATYAESMLDPKSPLLEVIRDIRIASERAAALNTSLLAYIGQAPQRTEPTDLAAVASDAVRMLAPLVDKAVKLRSRLSAVNTQILADPGQVSQVVVNLITNGAQAIGPGGGTVTVEVDVVDFPFASSARFVPAPPRAGRYARVRVEDTGEGMSQDVLERIFEPFFSTKGNGRGLGLSATLGIVGQHGGALAIESEPGKGSCFQVLLPLFSGPPVEASPASSRREVTRGGAILFVDDEKIVRQVGKRILERAGYEVVLAENGREALDVFTHDPDRFVAMIVDHSMPGMRGDELARSARSLRPELPLIKTSGYREVSDPDVDLHHTVILPKPYTRADLLSAVEKARGA
jgi:two-component system cell cycle sensor histidine kinase/response regulator CckA